MTQDRLCCFASRPSGKTPVSLEKLLRFSAFFAQDWGRAGDVAALGVCWHVPGQEEENFVFQLLSRLLCPELQRIEAHVSGEQPMSRCVVVFLFLSSWLSFLTLSQVIRLTHKHNKADLISLSSPMNSAFSPFFFFPCVQK